jgi:regulator of RNase E activity RraB
MRKLPVSGFCFLLACAAKNEAEAPPNRPAPAPGKTAPAPATGQWAVYPATIEGAPASVVVDLSLGERAPMKVYAQLLWVSIRMKHPGEHGMGVAEEARAFGPIEDALATPIENGLGAQHPGRIRSKGEWRLYYYARSSAGFKEAVDAVMKGHPTRQYTIGEKADPDWELYRTVLFPDQERMAWIMDLRVVQQLQENGDPLTEARRVDHWIYFPDAAARDRFAPAARAAGFAVESADHVQNGKTQPGIRIHRKDFVDIDRIHTVVMELKALAQKHGGEYDGWETVVLGPGAEPKP